MTATACWNSTTAWQRCPSRGVAAALQGPPRYNIGMVHRTDPHDPAHVSEQHLARGYLVWLGILSAITLGALLIGAALVRWLAPDYFQKLHF